MNFPTIVRVESSILPTDLCTPLLSRAMSCHAMPGHIHDRLEPSRLAAQASAARLGSQVHERHLRPARPMKKIDACMDDRHAAVPRQIYRSINIDRLDSRHNMHCTCMTPHSICIRKQW
jgi:hypothetical protein